MELTRLTRQELAASRVLAGWRFRCANDVLLEKDLADALFCGRSEKELCVRAEEKAQRRRGRETWNYGILILPMFWPAIPIAWANTARIESSHSPMRPSPICRRCSCMRSPMASAKFDLRSHVYASTSTYSCPRLMSLMGTWSIPPLPSLWAHLSRSAVVSDRPRIHALLAAVPEAERSRISRCVRSNMWPPHCGASVARDHDLSHRGCDPSRNQRRSALADVSWPATRSHCCPRPACDQHGRSSDCRTF